LDEQPAPHGAEGKSAPAGRWAVSPLLLQLLIAELTVMAAHAARPMVTYRALGLGASPVEIGLLQSAFSVLPLLTAVALGRWVDRVGEFRGIAIGCASISVGAVIAAVSPSLLFVAVGQLFMGFGLIAAAIASQAAVANRGAQDRRVERFGWYAVAVSIGQLAGPAVGAALVVGLGSAVGGATSPPPAEAVAPVFIFAAIAAGVAIVLGLALPYRGPIHPGGAAINTRVLAATAGVIRRPGMAPAMFVSIVVTASIDILIGYLPVFGTATGLGVGTVGALLAVRAGASLVSRALMGRMSAAIGIDRLLFASTAVAGAGMLLLPIVSTVPWLFGVMVLVGLGLGVGQPMTVAWVANRSRPDERGLALGVRLTGNLAGLLIVPTAMGVLAGASGIEAIWIALAALLGLGALVARRTPFDDLVDDTRSPTD
jgi:MFS family permease